MAFRRAMFHALANAHAQDEVRSIPQLIKFNAQYNPSHTFCLQHNSRDGSLRRITHGELDAAVTNCIRDLLRNVPHLHPAELIGGVLSKSGPVALMLESGIGFYVYLAALLALGVPVSQGFATGDA